MEELPAGLKLKKTTWVEDFERKWVDCLLAGQAHELALMCVPEFKLVTHVGDVLSREQLASAIETRRLAFSRINVIDLDVRVYPQTAIVTRNWSMTMTFHGRVFDGATVLSAVWLEQAHGSWKCALVHSTDARLRDTWKQLTSRPG